MKARGSVSRLRSRPAVTGGACGAILGVSEPIEEAMAMAWVRVSITILGLAVAVACPNAAAASGGGGGGGGQMPSVAAPQYDPVREYQRGLADYQAGKFKDAVRDFEHVTEVQPRVANPWYMLGLSRAGVGDLKGAAHVYEKAIKLDAAPVPPHREYGVTLAKLKQTDKAGAELAALKTRAAACNSTCPEAADLAAAVAAIEQAMAAGAPAAQLTQPASLLFASAADGDAAYVRAVSLINERRYAEALVSLDAAEAAFGPHPDVLTYKGYVWRKLGQLDRAESYYQAALAAAPTHRGATEYYGELKVIRGDLVGARAMLGRLEAQCAFGCAEAEELRRWIDRGGDPLS
jgi:tetratricopeptide (TPR) repeat protein